MITSSIRGAECQGKKSDQRRSISTPERLRMAFLSIAQKNSTAHLVKVVLW